MPYRIKLYYITAGKNILRQYLIIVRCAMLYYTLQYYYCTILHYIILNFTTLHYIILYYTILHYIILYYTILYYTTLYYAILYYTILYYTLLSYTIFCIAFHNNTVQYCMRHYFYYDLSCSIFRFQIAGKLLETK